MALANRMHEALNEDTGINATRSAANSLAEEIDYQHTEGEKGKARDNLGMLRDYEAMMRINARKVSEGVAEAIFVNEAKTINEKKPYTIEAILRNSFGEIFHPNAVRYMLYMLEHRFAEKIQTTQNRLNNEIIPNLETYAPDANETGMFDVKFNGKKKERNLDELCAAEKAGDANPNLLEKLGGYEKIYAKLNEFFPDYFATITDFGNLTAGLFAKRMGLPVKRFIAANNRNDIFYHYLQTGSYEPRPSVATIANAMDVGDPSNFARILDLYGRSLEAIRADISAARYDDGQICRAIAETLERTGYLLDPHGACGYLALCEGLREDETGVFLETAHPAKFRDLMSRWMPYRGCMTCAAAACCSRAHGRLCPTATQRTSASTARPHWRKGAAATCCPAS